MKDHACLWTSEARVCRAVVSVNAGGLGCQGQFCWRRNGVSGALPGAVLSSQVHVCAYCIAALTMMHRSRKLFLYPESPGHPCSPLNGPQLASRRLSLCTSPPSPCPCIHLGKFDRIKLWKTFLLACLDIQRRSVIPGSLEFPVRRLQISRMDLPCIRTT